MESTWFGTAEDAFFNGDAFDRSRTLQLAEQEYSGRSVASAYYIIGVDVGRKNDLSECIVIRVTPQSYGPALKSVVNIFTLDKAHFEDQAVFIKKLYYRYKAKTIVIDANGAGIGLVDYLVKPQVDRNTGDVLPKIGPQLCE